MFKDCKRGGYNLEDSQAPPDRLIKLILLIALAMTSAWLHGQRTQLQGQQKYVYRLTEKGRHRRRHSNFWIGLYGESWLVAFQSCQLWVEEMLSLIANKKSFYQRGLRAINLIDQPLKRLGLGRPLNPMSLGKRPKLLPVCDFMMVTWGRLGNA